MRIVNERLQALLAQGAVDERQALRDRIVEDYASDRGVDDAANVFLHGRPQDVLRIVFLCQIDQVAGDAQFDRSLGGYFFRIQGEQHFLERSEHPALAFRAFLVSRQVINTEHDVLGRHGNRLAAGRTENVVGRKHQHRGFDLSFRRERNVNRHLVAVKVGVERGADERVDFDRLTFDQHRLERLNAQAVQCWRAVEQHRVLANNFLENVPHNRFLPFDHFTRLLDRGRVCLLLELVIDEWLEKFERHLFRQTALVQF